MPGRSVTSSGPSGPSSTWTPPPRRRNRSRRRGPARASSEADALASAAMAGLDFDRFDVLTFDCYGTLIDWEAGILAALRAPLAAHGIEASDEQVLEAFARHEAEIEA